MNRLKRTRNALSRREFCRVAAVGGIAAAVGPLSIAQGLTQDPDPAKPATNGQDALKHTRTSSSMPGKYPARVVLAHHENALANNAPDVRALEDMLSQSMCAITGAPTAAEAWRNFVDPKEIIGLKVNPVAGKLLSTSPQIVTVIIRQLEEAGVPRKNIVIWDRREFELHEVGFTAENFPGIRIVGTECKDDKGSFYNPQGKLYGEERIDREWFYWADVEEHYDAGTLPYMVNEGKHSYYSTICTKDVDKIINVPILKNAGSTVTLALKNLAYGAITNTQRLHKQLWAETCAEVPAFPPLRDKTVLNIVDGIRGCYNGGPGANPQFFTDYKVVLVGTDPVAVDRIGYDIVLKKRLETKVQKEESPRGKVFLDMAQAMGLGTADVAKIELEKITL